MKNKNLLIREMESYSNYCVKREEAARQAKLQVRA
ncbi:hypothetical protein NIES4071_27840 [Calothrix sp. NIES-4071]|nr:hypothetical protein NIES4071_27840 [Calothrix sp. NIES-4071]BAZ57106.1 hypothetical protein NIES4105_27780 [Calothrix sp. NIES-4105]